MMDCSSSRNHHYNDLRTQINIENTSIKEEIDTADDTDDNKDKEFPTANSDNIHLYMKKYGSKRRKTIDSLVLQQDTNDQHFEIKSEDKEEDEDKDENIVKGIQALNVSNNQAKGDEKSQGNHRHNLNAKFPESVQKIYQLLFPKKFGRKKKGSLTIPNDECQDHFIERESFSDEFSRTNLSDFIRSFFEYNKDSFLINLTDNFELNPERNNYRSDDGENSRTPIRSTRNNNLISTTKTSLSLSSKKPKKKSIDKKHMFTKLTTKKFLTDSGSSLVLRLNSFVYDPNFPIMYGVAFNPYSYPDNVFAVCGNTLVLVYRCLPFSDTDGLLPLFAHIDRNDSYYCCCWSYDVRNPDHYFLIVAGEKGIIRVIDVREQQEVKTYRGHGSSINDLKVSPMDPTLLLSASKDSGIRLWNLATDTLVAIFGGVQGHRDEVLAVDFHQKRSIFASVSIDHSIKIWSLRNHEVAQAITESQTFRPDPNARQFPTVLQHYPNFSTRDVHHNYIDSVQWFGDFLITKSCDEKLIIWKPGNETESLDDLMRRTYHSDSMDSNGIQNVVLIRRFDLEKNNLWFVRFSLDLNEFLLAVGNLNGHLFIYDLKHFDPTHYCLAFEIPLPTLNFSKIVDDNTKNLYHQTTNKVIRQTAFNKDGSILIVLSENSSVIRYDLARVTKPQIFAHLQLIQQQLQKSNISSLI